MRLIQSTLTTLPQTKKPQCKFIAHLLGLILMLPGHATFRNLSLRQAQALQFVSRAHPGSSPGQAVRALVRPTL